MSRSPPTTANHAGSRPTASKACKRTQLGGLLQNGGSNNGATYTVRLHFCEPEPLQPGQRTFAGRLQGKTVVDRLEE